MADMSDSYLGNEVKPTDDEITELREFLVAYCGMKVTRMDADRVREAVLRIARDHSEMAKACSDNHGGNELRDGYGVADVSEIQESKLVYRAKAVAAVLSEYGYHVTAPDEATLDDVEKERWEACLAVVRALANIPDANSDESRAEAAEIR